MTMMTLVPADAVAIGIGAFFGALSRYQAGRVAAEWIATDPNRLGKFSGWHTAGINIGGSFLLGGITASPMVASSNGGSGSGPSLTSAAKRMDSKNVASAAIQRGSSSINNNLPQRQLPKQKWFPQGMTPRTKLMFGVGFCGSFTTFSTFSVDVVTWLSEGKTSRAFSYVATNNIGGIVAAAAGMVLVKKFFG